MTATDILALVFLLGVSPPQSGQAPRRIGGDVSPPIKIKNASPVYPLRLKQAGVQDLVILDATINTKGAVVDVMPLHGVPELVEPTIAAVRRWRYEAARLNGEPVEVVMTISVGFFVDGRPIVPVLSAALRDPNEQVRIKTIEYLSTSRLDQTEILALLRKAQGDDASAVRDAAEVAILTVQSRRE